MDPRKLVRIARWEVTKNAGGVDRRTLLAMAVAVVAMAAVGGLAAAGGGGGTQLDAGLYRIGIDESSPYYPAASADPTFAVRDPDVSALEAGHQDLVVRGTSVVAVAHSPKGQAALAEFRSAVEGYNERLMAREARSGNRTAAYPVSVTLQYERQGGSTFGVGGGTSGSGTDGGTNGGGTGGGNTGGTSGGGTGGGTSGGVNPGDFAGGVGGGLTGRNMRGTPADIAPPFPFESLVLAFLFIVPLNFVIQAYGSTMLSERLNRRGELLLVSPVTRADVIAGKTLPYFLAAMGVVTTITLGLRFSGIAPGGGVVAVLAVTPLALLFLAATFCGAMFARSFKELTFVTVTVTVSLTSYAFVPAIFTQVTPVALISPLTLVVRDLQSQAVSLTDFLFSTAPPTLTALVLFGLGAGLYREEDMFTQRSIPLKVLDALAGRIARPASAFKLSVILLPFVFVAELAAIALLFALGSVSIVLVIAAVVVVEELAKSLHLYAGYAHARYERSLRSALVVGALSGVGFFVAEKFVLVARLVGLGTVPAGRAALVTGLAPSGVPVVLVAALFLVAPLALHVLTASVSSLGARRNRRAYAVALLAAMAIHFAYNYTVVTVLVG
ncbi:MAG: PrsW family intramembrane metalloprotease [Haloarculaceae archaeon]